MSEGSSTVVLVRVVTVRVVVMRVVDVVRVTVVYSVANVVSVVNCGRKYVLPQVQHVAGSLELKAVACPIHLKEETSVYLQSLVKLWPTPTSTWKMIESRVDKTKAHRVRLPFSYGS